MFRYTMIRFYDPEKGNPSFQKLIDEFYVYIPSQLKKWYYPFDGFRTAFPLLTGSEEMDAAIKRAKELGISVSSMDNAAYFTKKEQENAPFFRPELKDPLEFSGTSPKYYGTEYSDECPICKQFGTLKGDILIDRKYMRLHSHGIGELGINQFVSASVRKLIEDSGFTGISFGEQEVKDYKGREMDTYYVMKIHSILPPMYSEATSFTVLNKSCGHTEIAATSEFFYETKNLDGAMDFNYTNETFWRFGRMLVLSNRVMRVFKENKVPVLHYFPVVLL